MGQPPSQTKVFISYSHQDIAYRKALLPALLPVRGVGNHVWYDEREIDYGDKFDDEIQQALAATKIAILLLSHDFFNSDYIKQHELPFLLQQAELKRIRLAIVYVTEVSTSVLEIPIDINREPRTVDLKQVHAFNSSDRPLDHPDVQPGERNGLYAKLADWLRQQALHSSRDRCPGPTVTSRSRKAVDPSNKADRTASRDGCGDIHFNP